MVFSLRMIHIKINNAQDVYKKPPLSTIFYSKFWVKEQHLIEGDITLQKWQVLRKIFIVFVVGTTKVNSSYRICLNPVKD